MTITELLDRFTCCISKIVVYIGTQKIVVNGDSYDEYHLFIKTYGEYEVSNWDYSYSSEDDKIVLNIRTAKDTHIGLWRRLIIDDERLGFLRNEIENDLEKLRKLEDIEEELGITIQELVSDLKDLFRNHIELCIEPDRCYFKIKNSKGKDKSFMGKQFAECWEKLIKILTKEELE